MGRAYDENAFVRAFRHLLALMTPRVWTFRYRRRPGSRGAASEGVLMTEDEAGESVNRADDHGLPEAELTEEQREEAARRMADRANDAER